MNEYLKWKRTSPLYGKRVSILSDFLSAQKGSIPSRNTAFENEQIPAVFQTWWFTVLDFFGSPLLVNNSSAESAVTSSSAEKSLYPALSNSLRIKELKTEEAKPDYILVAAGLQDVLDGKEMERLIPGRKDFTRFEDAYEKMLEELEKEYSSGQVILLTLPQIEGVPASRQASALIKNLAGKHNFKLADLSDLSVSEKEVREAGAAFHEKLANHAIGALAPEAAVFIEEEPEPVKETRQEQASAPVKEAEPVEASEPVQEIEPAAAIREPEPQSNLSALAEPSILSGVDLSLEPEAAAQIPEEISAFPSDLEILPEQLEDVSESGSNSFENQPGQNADDDQRGADSAGALDRKNQEEIARQLLMILDADESDNLFTPASSDQSKLSRKNRSWFGWLRQDKKSLQPEQLVDLDETVTNARGTVPDLSEINVLKAESNPEEQESPIESSLPASKLKLSFQDLPEPSGDSLDEDGEEEVAETQMVEYFEPVRRQHFSRAEKRQPESGLFLYDKTLVLEDPASGKEYTVSKDEVFLGRQLLDNDITLKDAKVSRKHAKFAYKNGVWVLRDLKSANGTYINQLRIPPESEHVLREGDVLRFSDLTLNFKTKRVHDK